MNAPLKPQALDLAVIGNNRIAALLDTKARLVWWCFPRLDSDPVLCRLIAGDEEKGFSDRGASGLGQKRIPPYVHNTAIVVTTAHRPGWIAQVRITDFAPRFRNFERMLRPPQLMRVIEPVAGLPHITIRLRALSALWQADDRGVRDRQQSHHLWRAGVRCA